jgi:hypothetical protein
MGNRWYVGSTVTDNDFPGIIDELMVSNFAKSAQDIEDYYLATR